MKRRNFLQFAGLASLGLMLNRANTPAYNYTYATNNVPIEELSPQVFSERINRARSLMRAAKVDLLFTLPSTNLAYLAKLNTWRSERLMALLVPIEGEPVMICPAFEEERIRRTSVVSRIATWQESENPHQMTIDLFNSMKATRIGMEPSTDLSTYWKLRNNGPKLDLIDASEIFTNLRIQKTSDEIASIRQANKLTLAAIAATHNQLSADKTELDILRIFTSEMEKLGVRGGGTVQFGPGSALPHGGPGQRKLTRGMCVLMDVSCQVNGYFSDITRTIYWGNEQTAKYKEVYEIVAQAQQAGIAAARPGVECQAVDRAARAVIDKAGYGKYFTHRLGHGMGLEIHEPPYLVEGNSYKLLPGNVVTVEPGIYLPDEFGVRIEDDILITEKGAEVISKG